MHSFSIVIPIYNESNNIKILLKEIYFILKDNFLFEVIIVNDGSNDESKEIIEKLNYENLVLINNDKNLGQSKSLWIGIKNSRYETIVTIDGDLQNDPKDIPMLIDYYKQNNDIDLVGGIRTKRKDNLIKMISSKIANTLRSFIFKDGCIDTGCSLKVFNKKVFLNFPYFNGIHRFLPSLYTGYNKKTFFLNVNHRARIAGVSKYGTFNRLYKGVIDIIRVKNIIKNYQNQKNILK